MDLSIVRRYTAFVVIFAWVSLASFAGEETRLEWKWKQGEIHHYSMTQNMTISMEMTNMPGKAGAAGFGSNMDTTQEQVMTLKEEVIEVAPDGTATIEQTIETIRMEMNLPGGGKMIYDSEKPEETVNPMAGAMQPLTHLVGTSFTIVRDKTGKILEMRGMQAMMEGMMANLEDNPMAAQMKNQFTQMFTDENFESMNQCSFEALPENAVGPGSSWGCTTSQTIPILGQLLRESSYTLEGFETVNGEECANIAFTFKGDQEPSDLGSGSNPMAQFMEFKAMKMEGSGNLLFAKEKGYLVKQTTKTHMDMEMEMKMPAGFPQGEPGDAPDAKPMTMKQHMEMEAVLERLD